MPLTLISLGFMNNKEVVVTTTASAAFFDVRTEYLYGLSEATVSKKGDASVWNNESVVDNLRIKTETKAFKVLVDEIEKAWYEIVVENTKRMTSLSSMPNQAPANRSL